MLGHCLVLSGLSGNRAALTLTLTSGDVGALGLFSALAFQVLDAPGSCPKQLKQFAAVTTSIYEYI